MNVPGEKLLKVSRILLIAISMLTLIFDCLSVVGLVKTILIVPDLASTFIIAFFISLASAIVQLKVGFWGLAPIGDIVKIHACCKGGAVVLGISLFLLILQILRRSMFSIFFIPLIVSALFLAGALWTRNSLRAMTAAHYPRKLIHLEK